MSNGPGVSSGRAEVAPSVSMHTILNCMHTLLQEMDSWGEMDSGEDDTVRPSTRRRVADDSDDDDMRADGQNRFGHGSGQEDDEEGDHQHGPLPVYELHRVDPDPFDWQGEDWTGSAEDLESAQKLMHSLSLLFDPQHYNGEAYAGMMAKIFNLTLTESQPDYRDIVESIFQQIQQGSNPGGIADQIAMRSWNAQTLISSIRATLLPHKAHPSVQPTYEQDMQLLDSMSSMVCMHKFTLLSIVAQQAGDLKIMADACIEMKPYEDLKDQVKLQKHLFRLFQQQKNRVYADKVSLSSTITKAWYTQIQRCMLQVQCI